MCNIPEIYSSKIEDFIKICYNDGMTENKYNDGQKFKVLELTKNAYGGSRLNELFN